MARHQSRDRRRRKVLGRSHTFVSKLERSQVVLSALELVRLIALYEKPYEYFVSPMLHREVQRRAKWVVTTRRSRQ